MASSSFVIFMDGKHLFAAGNTSLTQSSALIEGIHIGIDIGSGKPKHWSHYVLDGLVIGLARSAGFALWYKWNNQN